jgi:hypothetical protein
MSLKKLANGDTYFFAKKYVSPPPPVPIRIFEGEDKRGVTERNSATRRTGSLGWPSAPPGSHESTPFVGALAGFARLFAEA